MKSSVCVIGAGLAGSEAAFQLAMRGYQVQLYEMRPEISNGVHTGGGLAELVCSNSFRSDDPTHPVGLLKREMEALESLIIKAARATTVPAGGALAVDRKLFSEWVTNAIEEHPRITLIRQEVRQIPEEPAIIATGPLCADHLAGLLFDRLGDSSLYFYDAIAPVVDFESLDMDVLFFQSRYEKGDGKDYLNIPLSKEEYLRFHHELIHAEMVEPKKHEKMKYFEGCLPIEVMAERGIDTLRFGPMKPVGIVDPKTELTPYAVVQLRQDDMARSLWNIVGFQTKMKWGEQKRILRSLPGLKNARFTRYGMIHRNTYLNSPKHLETVFRVKGTESLFVAGQISGVEGYLESAASGLMAAFHLHQKLSHKELLPFPAESALGSLAHYISFQGHRNFQPTNVNLGIFPPSERKIPKKLRRQYHSNRAWKRLAEYLVQVGEPLKKGFPWPVE